MKRFFVIAVAIALTACMGNTVWSQGGQGGGGGAVGGGGAAGGAGSPGAAGTHGAGGAAGAPGISGTPGRTGAAGTAGTAGTGRNGAAAGNAGATGNAQARTPGNANATAQGRVGANAQQNSNLNGINPTPFFAEPGVRQQLRLNNNQFNQLSQAYQQGLQRYNQNLAGFNTRPGTGGAAAQRAQAQQIQQRQQELQARANANANLNASGTVGTDAAAQQRALRLQEFQSRFDADFNGVVDTTFTDPALRQRFNQLNWQYQGVGAFNDPLVQRQLNLTPKQRQQLSRLAGEWRRDLMNLQRGSRTNLTQEQFNDLRTEFMTEVNSVLTPTQQQMWTTLVGQSYDYPMTVYFPQQSAAPVQGQVGVQPNATDAVVPQGGTSQAPQPGTTVR